MSSRLLAKSPADSDNARLKLFMYGAPGVGKTYASIQFPNAYIIDAEKGTEHYGDLIRSTGGSVFKTSSAQETLEQVRALREESHNYHTLVIDPVTTLYSDLLDAAEAKVGDTMGRHYNEANKHMKRLFNMLTALDMNVVVTAHAKVNYGPNLTNLGQTFDGWKRLPYLFDVVVQIIKSGSQRLALVEKSRIPAFEDGEQFTWSYAAVAERFSLARLERTAVAVALAEPDQVRRVTGLINQLTEERRDVLKLDTWLSKAGVGEWEDMPAEIIEKCITRLEKEVLGLVLAS